MKEMTLRELQLFALDILKDVHQFCTQNNIKYSLYAGTLLGAIRHQGFIPWDDDIDIVMPRDDYDRFCQAYRSEKFFLTNKDNDSSFQLAYSRVCDIERTVYKAVEPCSKKPTGVWIDVFPADGCPPKEEIPSFYEQNRILFQETEKVRWSMASFYSEWIRISKACGRVYALKHIKNLFKRKLHYKFCDNKQYWVNKLIDKNMTYQYDDSNFWSVFTFFYKHTVYFPKDTFETCEMRKFEDSSFFVMCGWDNVLSTLYGDYMKFPPVEQQKPQLRDWYTFYWKQS